jgi:acyl-CoA thioester hydrolase
MKSNPRRLDLAAYPHRVDIPPRFSDVDPYWHLNNVRLMEYYQEARLVFHRLLSDAFDFEREKNGRVLVAHVSADYLQEVHYPEAITLGMGILRVGNSSYTIAAAMFQKGRCVGLSNTVMNATKEGAVALPAELVAVLNRNLLADDAL